ncbi:MAG: M48 family metallopeptidase [Clostridia bacterium]|nr:M48 family metallopeptidase [Clostridia bacterium]
METVEFGGITCFVKRSSRRTVCLRVRDDGEAEILAPRKASAAEIVRLLEGYAPKIAAECEKNRQLAAKREAFALDYGSRVRFLGGERVIRAGEHGYVGYDSTDFYVPPSLSDDGIRAAVVAAYKQAARDYLNARVTVISDKMGLEPLAVKVNSAISHWASCSKKSSLNFSFYCMMAEPEAVDYIIIHELCHMREFNHSRKFWAEVEKYCPDYKRYRMYLRDLWREIRTEKWE